MEIKEYHLQTTVSSLEGPSKEQIIVFNQWAATALDKYHKESKASFVFRIDGKEHNIILSWESRFTKNAMKERKKMAEEGGVALAMFVMSVLLDYRYVEQSEIGDGVDYRFIKDIPDPNSLNFLANNLYVEVSGLLEETPTNNLANRIKIKHAQIEKGFKHGEPASVIITLFNNPVTVKEKH